VRKVEQVFAILHRAAKANENDGEEEDQHEQVRIGAAHQTRQLVSCCVQNLTIGRHAQLATLIDEYFKSQGKKTDEVDPGRTSPAIRELSESVKSASKVSYIGFHRTSCIGLGYYFE